jgi:GTP-binding protein Era
MERLFDRKVYLETWVKVREGWSDDERALHSLGYAEPGAP